MGFFTNLFVYPNNDPWIQDMNEKISNAETDEEREMYQNELDDRLSLLHCNWW
jgi:hypothetical protein